MALALWLWSWSWTVTVGAIYSVIVVELRVVLLHTAYVGYEVAEAKIEERLHCSPYLKSYQVAMIQASCL